jgi:predicted phage terminase large subunit-like protein
VVVSVDASFGSLTADASNVAIHAWGMAGVDSYLVGRLTKKMGFADTKAAIRRMAVLHGADTLLVEKKANGAAIIEELESEWVVIPYNPDWGDKRMRAEASTPMVEAGTVHLPDDEDGHEVRALAARFPNAVQDDDVDAMSAFLNWRRKRGRFMEWWRYLAGQADRKDDKPAGPEGKTGDEIRREMHEASLEALGISRRKKRQPDPSAPGTPPPSVPVERDVGHGGTPAINAQPPPPPAPPLLPCSCGMTRWFCGSRGRKCMSCGEVVEYPNPK